MLTMTAMRVTLRLVMAKLSDGASSSEICQVSISGKKFVLKVPSTQSADTRILTMMTLRRNSCNFAF